jgi:hypothetical protein
MALDLKLEETFTYKKGKSEGEKKNRDKMILSFYKNTKQSIREIAISADVSEQYVIDLLKAENIVIKENVSKKAPNSKGKK